jgi:hypothetical protein
METLGASEAESEANPHWDEAIAQSYKEFLLSNGNVYPENLCKTKRRNFRKRAGDFEVNGGQLYYIKSGCLRLALSKREDWQRVFQVSCE